MSRASPTATPQPPVIAPFLVPDSAAATATRLYLPTRPGGEFGSPAAIPAAGVPARREWLRAAGARLARFSQTSAAKAAGAPSGRAERVLTTDRDPGGSLIAATGAAIYYQDAARLAADGRGGDGRTWAGSSGMTGGVF